MKAITTAELIGAYIAGASTLALAERYPLSRTAIHYRLKRAGVQLRRMGAPEGNQNAKGRRRMMKPRCTLCGAAATRTLGNRPVCAFCYHNGPLGDYPQEFVIGACDDCGAEGVRIWRTEFNWQCQTCKAQNDDDDDQ